LEFNLTLYDIVLTTHCPLNGTKFDLLSPRVQFTSPTLDRIDSTKGYIKGNVWVVSWRANRIKCDASIEELELITKNLRARIIDQ